MEGGFAYSSRGTASDDANKGAVTPQNRIIVVAFPDTRYVKSIRNNPSPRYPHDVDQKQGSMFQRELAFEIVPRTNAGATKEKRIFAALNGAFSKDETDFEIYRKMRFAGQVLTEQLMDPRGKENTRSGVSVQCGGSNSLLNTGNEFIKANDIVIWKLPDPSSPINRNQKNDKRIVPWTVPYRPWSKDDQNYAMLASNFHTLVNERHIEKSEFDKRDKDELSSCAQEIRSSVLKLVLVAIDMLCRCGVITPNANFINNRGNLTPTQRSNAANTYMANHIDFLSLLHDFMHIKQDYSGSSMNISVAKPNGTQTESTLDKILDDVLFNMETQHPIYQRNGLTPLAESQQKVDNCQKEMLPELLSSLEMMRMFFRSRIVCRALTSAGPGEQFDGIFGAV